MKRLFPDMYDRPGNWMPAVAIGYWLFAFWFNPFWLPFVGDGFWDDPRTASWLDIVYHIINAVAIVAIFKNYALESFFNVQLDTKKFFKTVGVAALVMLALATELYLSPVPMVADAYPISEMSGIAVTPGLMVSAQPVFGTLCHVLITPIAVAGLFYVPVFAPMCCRKPWLGYVMVTLALAIPSAFDILWRGQVDMVIPLFLLNLPIHLIACWSYQKTDTVWAPIATLSIFNLFTSLMSIFFIV